MTWSKEVQDTIDATQARAEQIRASIRERFPKRDDRTYDHHGQPTHKTIVLTIEQYNTVIQAWRKQQAEDGQDVTRGQAVERCCADWLAGN